ncbi:Alpha/Beta hydrolase protein [Pholiota molesta]|nr:Alpha/Beta hydrolase protein [Pholiota molesta]
MDRKYTLCQYVWNWQRMLVYPPAYFYIGEDYYEPDTMFGPHWANITLTTKDSVALHCYLIKHAEDAEVKRSRGTFIMFHGNAMFKSNLLPYAYDVFSAHFNVLAVEYRGYPGNKGRPSEKGLRLDAQAALDYILAHPILSTKPVIAFGQSMGGAVAIALTSHNAPKIRALVVENTFTSIPDLLRGRMPWCLKWIRYLCTQRWDSRGRIGTLPSGVPVLMLSGLRDTVVPAGDMRRLWGAAQRRHGGGGRWGSIRRLTKKTLNRQAEDGKRAEADIREQVTRDEFFTFEYGGHVDTRGERGYVEALHAFLDKVFPEEAHVNSTLPSRSDLHE